MSIVRTSPVKPRAQRPAWDTLKPMPASLVSDRRPLIIGHRGAKGLAPENTLAAFQVAADLGIDGVEFDVQRTQNGHLIVFHDDTVDRTTDGTGKIETLSLNAIKALDAGRNFDPKFQGERIPTLREAFEFLRATPLLLFIELKEPWRFPGIEAEVVALIREYDLVEQVQVRSFYHDALHAIYHLAPEIALSGLWLDRLPSDDEVTFKTINALAILYTAENIAHIHQRGQLATAWVVNDLVLARELMVAGIDGLTSDYPDQLLGLFE
jgi:glycerophosphoryl diester phosphodiesterase